MNKKRISSASLSAVVVRMRTPPAPPTLSPTSSLVYPLLVLIYSLTWLTMRWKYTTVTTPALSLSTLLLSFFYFSSRPTRWKRKTIYETSQTNTVKTHYQQIHMTHNKEKKRTVDAGTTMQISLCQTSEMISSM